MDRDFSIKKYKQLLLSLIRNDYLCIPINEYITSRNYKSKKIAVLRHDIDTKYDLPIAINMAKFESANGLKASYYFRTVPETLDLNVIQLIANLGHEIGYHYEVMSLTKGDEKKAIELFRKDLKVLRKVCPIKTICQHGGAMGHYNTTSLLGLFSIGKDYLKGKIKTIEYYPSTVIWNKYSFADFGLNGDAYLSLDFTRIKYFSDTGQRWDNYASRILDKTEEGNNSEITASTTNDLIQLIEHNEISQVNLLVHPANWHDNISDWIKWRILQKIRNTLKRLYNPKVNY